MLVIFQGLSRLKTTLNDNWLEQQNKRCSCCSFLFLYALVPLLFGAMIYGLFRRIVWINSGVPFIEVKGTALGQSSLEAWITHFIIYTLPDAIWSFSLVIFVGALWINKESNRLFWILFGFFLGTSFEIGQFFGLFNGYFCIDDLVASAIASLLAVQWVFYHFKYLLVTNNEKQVY